MSTVDPQPGDLIEIPNFLFQHWAVYIGDGLVVHLTVPNGSSATSSSSSGCSGGKALVKKEKLKDVAPGNNWKVNNLMDGKYRHRDAKVIVEEALKLVGTQPQFYLLGSNCEHFATNLRYGIGESRQVIRVVEGVMRPELTVAKTLGWLGSKAGKMVGLF